MANVNILETIVSLNVSLIPAQTVVSTIGELLVMLPKGAGAVGAFTVSTAADVATLLTATSITADGAAALNTALTQNRVNRPIRVITYASAAVDAAFTLLDAQTWDVGVIAIRGINDVAGDLTDINDHIVANPYRYAYVVESPNGGLLSSGQPAALAALQSNQVYVVSVAAATSGKANGVAFGAVLSGTQLIGVDGGPAGTRIQLNDVDVRTLTSTQLANLTGNFAGAVLQLDRGNLSNERMMHGTKMYGGTGLTPVFSMLYTVRSVRAGIRDLILRKGILGRPILATIGGIAEVENAISARLDLMNAADHFVINEIYPKGYSVRGSVVGDEMTVAVYVRLAQEVAKFVFNLTGEVV